MGNNFIPYVPTYTEVLHAVSNIENLIYQFQSEMTVVITRHIYPYTIEVSYFNGYFHVHIFNFQGLSQLRDTINNLLLQPFFDISKWNINHPSQWKN